MNYYRKPIEKTINDVKLKMQIGALTLKLSENINKISDLLKVDEDIKKDIGDNLNLTNSNKENISKNDNEIYKKDLLISSNNISIYGHKNRLDVIEKDIKKIDLNMDVTNLKNDIKNNSDNITKNYDITQINKKKSEFNTDLIDNHTNTLKLIKNDIDVLKSNTYTPITSSKCFLNEIYLFNLDFIKDLDLSLILKNYWYTRLLYKIVLKKIHF